MTEQVPLRALLVGRTVAGSDYDLRLSVARSRLGRKRAVLELAVTRPGAMSGSYGERAEGPSVGRDALLTYALASCGDACETVVYGQLPHEATRLELRLPDGGRIGAAVSARDDAEAPRLYLASVAGLVERVDGCALDAAGQELGRTRFDFGRDPCRDCAPGARGVVVPLPAP